MDRAVTRVLRALWDGERVCVWGDYDADGLTATALLVTALQSLLPPGGAEAGAVTWHVPDRATGGYGLNGATLRRLRDDGVGLVVTVDCGVTAGAEAALARSLGVGLVITDHHEPGPALPVADAVVDPHRPGSVYPFPDLAGVGVAYKLTEALLLTGTAGGGGERSGAARGKWPGRPERDPTQLGLFEERGPGDGGDLLASLHDLVALGTVCDVVPLLGENRHLVARGLERLNGPAGSAGGGSLEGPTGPARTGLEFLCRVAGLGGKRVAAHHLGFQIGPRLNAAGRLGDAERALRLLLTRDPVEAAALAAELDQGNRERQALEGRILAEAVARLERGELDLASERAIVLAGEGWPVGIIGIVASRLVERFARPTVLVALSGTAGRGSGRSVPAFDLVGALGECAGRLSRYGGHRLAAGFEIDRGSLAAFAEEFLGLARNRLGPHDLVRELDIDAWVEPVDLAGGPGGDPERLLAELDHLEPHGTGNPEPIVALAGVAFASVRTVGEDGRHLKAKVAAGGLSFDAIGFGLGRLTSLLASRGEAWDIAFRPEIDEWNGVRRLQLKLIDVRRAGPARQGLAVYPANAT